MLSWGTDHIHTFRGSGVLTNSRTYREEIPPRTTFFLPMPEVQLKLNTRLVSCIDLHSPELLWSGKKWSTRSEIECGTDLIYYLPVTVHVQQLGAEERNSLDSVFLISGSFLAIFLSLFFTFAKCHATSGNYEEKTSSLFLAGHHCVAKSRYEEGETLSEMRERESWSSLMKCIVGA